jgi:hypothetical protein
MDATKYDFFLLKRENGVWYLNGNELEKWDEEVKGKEEEIERYLQLFSQKVNSKLLSFDFLSAIDVARAENSEAWHCLLRGVKKFVLQKDKDSGNLPLLIFERLKAKRGMSLMPNLMPFSISSLSYQRARQISELKKSYDFTKVMNLNGDLIEEDETTETQEAEEAQAQVQAQEEAEAQVEAQEEAQAKVEAETVSSRI